MVVTDPAATDRVQSIAAFASLHVSIVLTAAIIAQFVLSSITVRTTLWVYFGLTAIATIYFGWHYIADDIAGAVIAFISFYLGGIATGQKFDEHGRHSHPTTTTSDVPVETESSVPG
jgi:hypothetical protein